MKTTIKLAVLASALLLALAGCKNTFTPTDPSSDSFVRNMESGNTTKALYVMDVVADEKYNTGEYRVTVKFSQPVDLKTVTKAVTFYNLKQEGGKVVKGNSFTVSMEEGLDENTTRYLHFKFPAGAKDKCFWLEVVGKDLKGVGTAQKMDQDGDGVQGEDDDDFYAKYFKIGSPSFDVVDADIERWKRGADFDRHLNNIFGNGISFKQAYKADLTGTDSTLGNLVTHIAISNRGGAGFFSLEQFGISNETFVELVKNHIVVEQYVNNKWTPVDTSFESKDPHTLLDKYVVSQITVQENVQLRVRAVKLQDLKDVESKNYDYKLKYTADANEKNSLVLKVNNAETTDSGQKEGFKPLTASNWRSRRLFNTVDVTFNLPNTLEMYKAGVLKNVQVIKDGSIVRGYRGFVTTTLKPKNFQIQPTKSVYTHNNEINDYDTGIRIKPVFEFFYDNDTLRREKWNTIEILDISKFSNSDGGRYYAGTVNNFTINMELSSKPPLKISREDFLKKLKELYSLVHPNPSTSQLDLYKDAALTKAMYLKLTTPPLNKTNHDACKYIDHCIKCFVEYGYSLIENDIAVGLSLYISPDVQLAAFDGVVAGTTNKVSIGPLNFKQIADFSDPLRAAGWLKVDITP